jgi:hypothetical protein
MYAPVTSLRGLFALLLLASTVAIEHTAGVFVTTLFQGSVVLCLLALVAMRSQPTPGFRRQESPPPRQRVPLVAGGVP